MTRFALNLDVLWLWFCRFAGVAVISSLLTAAIIYGTAEDGPVVLPVKNLKVEEYSIPVGGSLAVVYDAERVESCPGYLSYTFTPVDYKNRPFTEVISWRRAIRPEFFVVGKYPHVRVVLEMVPSITPGKWQVEASVISQCPTREHVDRYMKAEFEVHS